MVLEYCPRPPSFSDFFFLAVLVWLFLAGTGGWSLLLVGGDCGWHLRTGELIPNSGSVARAGPFSFTRFGEPWFAWEWLSDVIFATLHRGWGLKGAVLAAEVLIAAFSTICG